MVRESLDREERPGTYFTPALQKNYDSRDGGHLVVIGTCSRGYQAALTETYEHVAHQLMINQDVVVAIPPIYAGDILRATNYSFAMRAMREFIEICLYQHPRFEAPRNHKPIRW